MLWRRRQHGATGKASGDEAGPRTALRRRGALTGLAVVVAGAIAKVSELPARAADSEPLLLGRINQADSRTELDKSSTTTGAALVITNDNGPGIRASGGGSTDPTGVRADGLGFGVVGETNSLGGIAGVFGSGRAAGVSGSSVDGIGVSGRGGTAGVRGTGSDPGGTGVFGVGAINGNGVFGQGGSNAAGVFGQAAQSNTPNTYGVFSSGRFGATGPITALITGTDGAQRMTFALSSPDSWIVDAGSATLDRGGRATVTLAPDFAVLIDTSNYQVFVTPYAESEGLFVSRRTPTSFDVASHHDGREANIAFGFQVVGKRKDVSVSRAAPANVQPTPPKPPKPPNMDELERRERQGR